MVVFLCFGSYILQSNFEMKMDSYALTKVQSENLFKLRTAQINRPMTLQLVICHKKELLSSLFYKTRATTQQVLPVQIGLYWYDE